MSKRKTLLTSAFLLGIITFGSQTSCGASVQEEALITAKANASTGLLISTGYKPLQDLSGKLKAVEGVNGPAAKQVLDILAPALLDLVNGVSAKTFGHANTALDVAAFFEGESGPVKAQLMEQIMPWTKELALETAGRNTSSVRISTTAYAHLSPIVTELRRLEGENGTVAKQMVDILTPGLLEVAKSPYALKIAALFEREDGPLTAKIKAAAAQP